jgi:hypothetical protein
MPAQLLLRFQAPGRPVLCNQASTPARLWQPVVRRTINKSIYKLCRLGMPYLGTM